MNKICNMLLSVGRYVKSLYQSILRQTQLMPALKLVSYERNRNTGEIEFLVQVTGKNIFPKLKLKEFTEDHSFLDSFSERDQAIIRQLFPSNLHPVTHKIVARTFDREKKQFIFKIEYTDEDNIKKNIIIDDPQKLSKHIHLFDEEDALIIGFEVDKQKSKKK